MSKIIRQPTAWWFDCAHVCPWCGCMFTVGVDDDIEWLQRIDSFEVPAVILHCPACKHDVESRRVDARSVPEPFDVTTLLGGTR